MPDVGPVLKVGGVSYAGWTSMRIQTSLKQVAGSFDLGLTEKFPGSQQSYQFKVGSPCTVTLGGRTVITGYVDEVNLSYDAGSHGISVRGRDVTGDLVDCSHLGAAANQWKGKTLLQVAEEVCRPFKIKVAAEVPVGLPFEDSKAGEGDSVLTLLVRLARQRQVMPVSYGDGRLVFTNAQERPLAAVLELGANIKAGQATLSNLQRFSSYQVKGQGQAVSAPDAGLTAEQKAEYLAAYTTSVVGAKGQATDAAVTRYRPLVILAESKTDPASCQARADWEAATRAGQSRRYSLTVQGWGPEGGGLWRINTRIKVTDAFLGLSGALLLVDECAYSIDAQGGSQTRLGLVHPDAYRAAPPKTIKGAFDA